MLAVGVPLVRQVGLNAFIITAGRPFLAEKPFIYSADYLVRQVGLNAYIITAGRPFLAANHLFIPLINSPAVRI